MIKLARLLAVAALTAGLTTPAAAQNSEGQDKTLLTAGEFVTALKMRNLETCFQQTEFLVGRATQIFIQGSGEQPDPQVVQQNVDRRNGECELKFKFTASESDAFQEELADKYGDGWEEVVKGSLPKTPSIGT